MNILEALRAVLDSKSKGLMMDAAKGYAAAWLNGSVEKRFPTIKARALQAQALYLRNNLSNWRGAEAKAAKAAIDAFIKENKRAVEKL